jgi:hypothetical protein
MRRRCAGALPQAKELYLRDLPPQYTSAKHEEHLQRALKAFHATARGPSVPTYEARLKEVNASSPQRQQSSRCGPSPQECTAMWKAGRQLCDAISCTGRPCVGELHNPKEMPHNSQFRATLACSCGRSRSLVSYLYSRMSFRGQLFIFRSQRGDPFESETANGDFLDAACCRSLTRFALPPHRMSFFWVLENNAPLIHHHYTRHATTHTL